MITVVGSANMDLVVQVQRLPNPGETVFGSDILRTPGGKGANQAVAAARAGGEVYFLGRLGNDANGTALLESMQGAGVHIEHVIQDKEVSTGTALITVDAQAENTIVVVPGANARVVPADLDRWAELLARTSVAVFQLEIPVETVLYAAAMVDEAGGRVVLNVAPATGLPPQIYRVADVLVANEEEVAALTGMGSPFDPASAAKMLVDAGVGAVIVTLGARGLVLVTPHGEEDLPAYPARAVDTTGAGDAFVGNLAAFLDAGLALSEADRFAAAAASLSTERTGAQASMPDRAMIEQRVRRGVQ